MPLTDSCSKATPGIPLSDCSSIGMALGPLPIHPYMFNQPSPHLISGAAHMNSNPGYTPLSGTAYSTHFGVQGGSDGGGGAFGAVQAVQGHALVGGSPIAIMHEHPTQVHTGTPSSGAGLNARQEQSVLCFTLWTSVY
jgi:hypothetical protein